MTFIKYSLRDNRCKMTAEDTGVSGHQSCHKLVPTLSPYIRSRSRNVLHACMTIPPIVTTFTMTSAVRIATHTQDIYH